jgi:hypothetical protein
MQIKAATEPVGEIFTWEAFDADADGDRRICAVLLEKWQEGKIATDAYAANDRCTLYCPLPGDQLNMLVSASGTGTGDSQAIGDVYIVDDGTGYLVATTGDPESEPFVCLETTSDVVATGTLVRCMYTGQ